MRYKVQAVVAVLLSAAIWNGEGIAQGDVDIVSCSAEALWVNDSEELSVRSGSSSTVMLHLVGHVSLPASCLPARVSLTAAYLDRLGTVLCVGTLENIVSFRNHSQDAAIEIGPLSLTNFARWRNEPGRRVERRFSPLTCVSPDGRANLLDNNLDAASSVEIMATVLPARGGLATAERRITIVR